jgi:hypothetical protein
VYTEHKLARHTHRPYARGIGTVPCPQTCSPEAQHAVQLRWLHPGTRSLGGRLAACGTPANVVTCDHVLVRGDGLSWPEVAAAGSGAH